MTLSAINGAISGVDGRVLGSAFITKGNFKSYAKAGSPWSAYTGMWGHYRATDLFAESSMKIVPETFPVGTRFNWDVVPSSQWGGINGYLTVSYGNYSDSPGQITPLQVDNIGSLDVDISWTYAGNASSGLLSELWLSSQSAAWGSFPQTHEIGFLPKLSASSQTWAAGLTVVGTGSFVANGITWNVRQSTAADGSTPYYIAYRPGYADFKGVLPYVNLFSFLKSAGKITGGEWVNGLAFGVEPLSGAASLTIDKFEVTYTQKVGVPAITDDFTGADGALDWSRWTHYGGTARVSNRARTPCNSDTNVAAMQNSSKILNLNDAPVWIELCTLPPVGNGTKISQISLSGSAGTGNEPGFLLYWSLGVQMLRMKIQGSAVSPTEIPYDSVAHRWFRFRVFAGNLLWETAPDGKTWTTRKSTPVPTGLTSQTWGAYVGSSYPGTSENSATAGYSEWDNFNIVPA